MKRVLVVDDQACVRDLVKQVLEMWETEVDVEEAEDGIEALHILARCTYDLMVCDIQMPNMDGVALLERVRKIPYHHDLPVLMLTGMKDERSITTALKQGATSYLTKPFNVAELLDALTACTDWDLRDHPMMIPKN